MKKKFPGQKFVKILLFMGVLLSTSCNILKSQPEGTTPKLTIIKADLGIFDNKIKHGEFVAFKNSPADRRDNTYAAAYYNWLEEESGKQHFILNSSTLKGKQYVFAIQKTFTNPAELRKKYDYAKVQYTGKYPDYKDEIVKQIFDKIKNGDFKGFIKKEDLRSGAWPELPFDENDFVVKIDDNPDLSSYEKELYKKTTFVHQYIIRSYEIKETDSVKLQVQSTGDYLGADNRYGSAMIWAKEWHGYAKSPDDQTTVWSLPKVNKNGSFVENATKVYIESKSNEPNIYGRKLQRFGVTVETQYVVIRNTPSDSFLNLEQNAYFKVYRIGPKSLDINTIITLSKDTRNIDKMITGRIDPIDLQKTSVIEKLNSLISKPDGVITIADGITFPNSTTGYNWKTYFGNPVLDTTGMSNLWLQLNVTYKLGRRTYTHMYNEWEENIQIPTQKELEEATNDLKSLQGSQINLEKLGFVKMPGRLIRISVNGKQVVGRNITNQVFKWDYDKKKWQSHPFSGIFSSDPLGRLVADPIGGLSFDQDTIWEIKNGIVFRSIKGIRNQFVKNKRMVYIATAPDKTTYVLDKDGNIFKWTGEDKFNSDDVWEQISGPKLKQISVGSEKYVCGIDKSGKVWKWNGYEFEEEPLISDAAQIEINNLGEIWLLVQEVQVRDYAVYYYAKNVWALNDKFALHSKASSRAGYLVNFAETPETNLQSGIDQSALWAAVNPENPNITGPLNYGATIILKASDNKFVSSDKDNNLIATSDINQAARFTIINQPKPSSRDEISKDAETPVLLKSGKKYLTVSRQQAMLSEKETPGLAERWVIEEY